MLKIACSIVIVILILLACTEQDTVLKYRAKVDSLETVLADLENKIANENSWFVLVDTFLVDSVYDDTYPSSTDGMVWMRLSKEDE